MLRREVQDHDVRDAAVGRDLLEETLDRLNAASRRADADDQKVPRLHLRSWSSRGSAGRYRTAHEECMVADSSGAIDNIMTRMAHAAIGKLRILLADDHETMREGLKAILNAQPDMQVVGEANDGGSVVDKARDLRPDIVVMDVSMPRVNGLKATEAIKQCCPGVKVLALTRHFDDGYVQQLLRAGAEGYVLKQSRAIELLRGLRAVAAGGKYLDPAVTSRVIGELGARRPSERTEAWSDGLPLSPARRRDSAPRRLGIQPQGDRQSARSQRQDGRDPQDQRDAQARFAQPDRYRPLRAARRLARRKLISSR